jgi:hypothetical protein
MANCAPNQYPVTLTAEERHRLEQVARNGRAPAKKIRHAQVLLLSDHDRPGGHHTEPQIAAALGMHRNTVARIRKRFVVAGERPALDRKPRATPPVPPKIDGRVEAHLIALCCGPPPAGRVRWTMALLARELVGRKIVTCLSGEAVRRALKKMNCGPGASNPGASPNATRPASSPRWKRSSTSTSRRRSRTNR